MKRCSKCREEKPATAEFFHRNRSDRSGFNSQCKDCTNYGDRSRYPNPDRQRQMFAAKLKREYGMTLEEYDYLRAIHGDRCKICGTTDPGGKRLKRLHIDHCHDTGKVRGLLCQGCNIALGHIKDDPWRAYALAYYLLMQEQYAL